MTDGLKNIYILITRPENQAEHLSKQLDNFPEDKRKLIQNKINSMSPEEIEIFIERNNLGHLGGRCIAGNALAP